MSGKHRPIRRAIDRDLAKNMRPWSVYLPLFTLGFAWFLATRGSILGLLAGGVVAIAAIAWFVYTLARAWHVARVLIVRSGEQYYDRVGKYALPPEYADTESADAARRRRRGERLRGQRRP
ncbi:hypothetical protein [Sphingomonas sp. LM7]|uniref:hypothetical protein n=1 Tax=Sphingomonas sp. LM7 TaxID=1938607 RepID=UPI0009839852|nr:hypothetical protein [Sphingomonas sp. LM7]AQR74272.1 hypothetical protein BXU08_11980 [Sphingomonas sp. LM7]